MKLLLSLIWLIQVTSVSNGGMNQLLKDKIQVVQWSVAIVGGLIAAFVGIFQLRVSTKQRKSELRWKKASLAREMLNEMWNDPYCSDAILMLEWKYRYYSTRGGNDAGSLIEINNSDVLSALADPGEDLDNKKRYVRDCFVRFFKTAEVLGHYVRIGLIDIDDLRYPYRSYLRKLDEGGESFYNFLNFYNFKNALRLLEQVRQMKPLPRQITTDNSNTQVF